MLRRGSWARLGMEVPVAGCYIDDFRAPSVRLEVEVDGRRHESRPGLVHAVTRSFTRSSHRLAFLFPARWNACCSCWSMVDINQSTHGTSVTPLPPIPEQTPWSSMPQSPDEAPGPDEPHSPDAEPAAPDENPFPRVVPQPIATPEE